MKLSEEMLKDIAIYLENPNFDIAAQKAAEEFEDKLGGEKYLDGSGYALTSDWVLKFKALTVAFRWSGEVSYTYTFAIESCR